MTDTPTDERFDIRSLPFPEALRWLRENGEPADTRPDVDMESLRRRFPRLADVSVTDVVVTAPHGPQPARVYRDDTATPSGRALVWVHGGAFIGGYLDMPESNWVALELAARGIPVFAVDYTKCLGDVHYPVPSDDVLAAWDHARIHAVELLGVESNALLLGGASAGGTLTAGAVARLRDAGADVPAGLVSVYPAAHPDGGRPGAIPDPASPMTQIALNYAGSAEMLADPHVFAGLGTGDGFPPTLVVVCELDGLRPSGEAFASLLADAGVDVVLHVELGADHAHINEPADPTALPTLEVIADWIGARDMRSCARAARMRSDAMSSKEVTFVNPVLAGDRPDPAVIRVGDEYWMTYSSFEAAPGLLLYRSTDLVNWTYECAALPNPVGNTFAVDIAEYDGRFFIYIPFIPAPWSTLTDASIFVIHAPSMSGPWSEPIDLGIRGVIDPGHVVGEDGRRYLFTSGVRLIQLTDDGLSTVGQLAKVYEGWRYPDEWITESYALEGPKLFQRNGWFYLVSAVGGTGGPPTGHMVIVARSRSVHGPWENSPHNPVARTEDAAEKWWSRGHATILPGPDGAGWWMLSHGYENGFRTLGRQILLEPITWTDEDWPVAGASDIGVALAAPTGAEPPHRSEGFDDDFAVLRLGERWTFHAPGPGESQRLHVDDGLWMAGKGTGPADTSPLAMLTGDHAYEVEVDLTVEPGVEAGLLLFFNNRLFCGMGIDGERMLSYSGGIRTHWREPVPATGQLTLRIRNDRHIVTGWYRVPDGEWTRHAVRYETSGYHANTVGDLLSLRPAIYAAGTGEARFCGFRYRSLR